MIHRVYWELNKYTIRMARNMIYVFLVGFGAGAVMGFLFRSVI